MKVSIGNIGNVKNFNNITLPLEKSSNYGDVDGLSLQNLFYANHGYFPGCLLFDYDQRESSGSKFNMEKVLDYFSSMPNKPKIIPYITNTIGETKKKNTTYLTLCVIMEEEKIYGRFQEDVTESYILFANESYDKAQQIYEDIAAFFTPREREENIYWRLCCSQGGYYLDKGNIKVPEVLEIEKVYNDDFINEDKKIKDFIEQEDKSGLIILHGEKGTGKSSYIKNLVNAFPTKKFVYVPANLVNLLGDPSFGSFLTTLNNHVIVLEDCENVIKDRKTNISASGVSLLLNMTDGILSDDLGIKFICTFNEDMKNIDPALLRKGRLICKYEFKPLDAEKATALLKERGKEVLLTKPITLAELFHYGEDSYEETKKSII